MTSEVSSASDPPESPPVLIGPKRQHFLPRFYLERFIGDDNCVAVFDRDQNQLRRQQPQNTGVVGHLYTMEDEHGRQRFEIEQELARIEADASSIFGYLAAGENLDTEQRSTLSLFIALAAVRTPEFIDGIKHLNGEMIKIMTRHVFSDVEQAKNAVRKQKNAPSDEASLESEARALMAFVEGTEYDVVVDHQYAVQMALPLANSIAPTLSGRHWRVFQAPLDKGFVTCDAPVHLGSLEPRPPGLFRGAGFGAADALVLFALDARHMLAMFGNKPGSDRVAISGDRVRRMNLAIAGDCQRFLVGRDDALVASIAKASGIIESKWQPKFRVN